MNDAEALALVRSWARRSVKLRDEQLSLIAAIVQTPGSPFGERGLTPLPEPGFEILITDPGCDWFCAVKVWSPNICGCSLGSPSQTIAGTVEAAAPHADKALRELEARVEYLRQLSKIRVGGGS